MSPSLPQLLACWNSISLVFHSRAFIPPVVHYFQVVMNHTRLIPMLSFVGTSGLPEYQSLRSSETKLEAIMGTIMCENKNIGQARLFLVEDSTRPVRDDSHCSGPWL